MYVNPETYRVHPEFTRTEKEMQAYLFLEEHGVEYLRAEHDEAATIELCEEVESILGVKICKNLLLCNRQQTEFYLLLMPGDLPFRTKIFSRQIGSSRLSFASGEQMETLLNTSPGSLSVLSLLFDPERRVHLMIEKHVLSEAYFACHPCVNTATVCFSVADLKEKVLPQLRHTVTYVDLELTEDEM